MLESIEMRGQQEGIVLFKVGLPVFEKIYFSEASFLFEGANQNESISKGNIIFHFV